MPGAESPILFPTDFQSHSTIAFEHALRLATNKGCPIIALHVANMPDMCGSRPGGPSFHEELRAQLQTLDSPIVHVDRRLLVADPGPAICQVASVEGCQLIFFGMTNKTGADLIGLGTVHEYLMHHAPCPIVTLCVQPHAVADHQLL